VTHHGYLTWYPSTGICLASQDAIYSHPPHNFPLPWECTVGQFLIHIFPINFPKLIVWLGNLSKHFSISLCQFESSNCLQTEPLCKHIPGDFVQAIACSDAPQAIPNYEVQHNHRAPIQTVRNRFLWNFHNQKLVLQCKKASSMTICHEVQAVEKPSIPRPHEVTTVLPSLFLAQTTQRYQPIEVEIQHFGHRSTSHDSMSLKLVTIPLGWIHDLALSKPKHPKIHLMQVL